MLRGWNSSVSLLQPRYKSFVFLEYIFAANLGCVEQFRLFFVPYEFFLVSEVARGNGFVCVHFLSGLTFSTFRMDYHHVEGVKKWAFRGHRTNFQGSWIHIIRHLFCLSVPIRTVKITTKTIEKTLAFAFHTTTVAFSCFLYEFLDFVTSVFFLFIQSFFGALTSHNIIV